MKQLPYAIRNRIDYAAIECFTMTIEKRILKNTNGPSIRLPNTGYFSQTKKIKRLPTIFRITTCTKIYIKKSTIRQAHQLSACVLLIVLVRAYSKKYTWKCYLNILKLHSNNVLHRSCHLRSSKIRYIYKITTIIIFVINR